MNGNNSNGISMRDVSRTIREKDIKFLDLKFSDLPGGLQHITLPVENFNEKIFVEGIGFDGSSVRAHLRQENGRHVDKGLPVFPKHLDGVQQPTLTFLC